MTNKEIKVGSKIWLYTHCLSEDSFYVVKSVKKDKTLVSIVVDARNYTGTMYEIKMYGHASSSLLSGYDSKWGHKNEIYTCDYSLIEDKTKWYERDRKYCEAGLALLNIVKYFK